MIYLGLGYGGEMKTYDKLISVAILGLPVPVLFLITFWWPSALLFADNEKLIAAIALLGLTAGILTDIFLFRNKLFSLFTLNNKIIFALCTLYSIWFYGMLMGLPVLVCLPGPVFSYVIIKRDVLNGESNETIRSNFNKLHRVAAALLLIACFCTAIMALTSKGITAEVQGMLRLGTEVSMTVVWLLIIFGGIFLLLLQWLASKTVEFLVLGKLSKKNN